MAILKLFHVLTVFLWIGSLLTVTRLLWYVAKENHEAQNKMLSLLKKIYLSLELPAMTFTVVLGIILLIMKDINLKAPWLHMKLTFAFLLIIADIVAGRAVIKHHRAPPWRYCLLHGLILILVIIILIAIYIFKAAYTC